MVYAVESTEMRMKTNKTSFGSENFCQINVIKSQKLATVQAISFKTLQNF